MPKNSAVAARRNVHAVPETSSPEHDGSSAEGVTAVLLWLALRLLPPLDRADQRTLIRVGAASAYLVVPLTVALAADDLPRVTAVSLLCLSVPGLPPLWRHAIRLGDRRRATALALRQARLHTRAATMTSLSRQLAYPFAGALLGELLILSLHPALHSILPGGAPLAVAIENSAHGWLYAAPLAVLLMVALTTLLGTRQAKAAARLLRRLGQPGRRAAQPQPQ